MKPSELLWLLLMYRYQNNSCTSRCYWKFETVVGNKSVALNLNIVTHVSSTSGFGSLTN